MYKSVVCVFILSSFCLYLQIAATEENKVKAEHCTYEGIEIKEGESAPAPLGECMMVTCFNAAENHFSFRICKNFVLNPGCKKIDYDVSKPYPECCPRQVCNSGNH